MELDEIRKKINMYDEAIRNLLVLRMSLIPVVADIKEKNKLPLHQEKREKEIYEKLYQFSIHNGLNPSMLENIYNTIISNALLLEEKTLSEKDSSILYQEKNDNIDTMKENFQNLEKILLEDIPSLIEKIKNTNKNITLKDNATIYYNQELNDKESGFQ